MKKIIILIIILLTLYIGINIKDNKVDYLSLGDGLSLGINENNYTSIGYSDYIKDYLESKNKLKSYIKEFSDKELRVTDIINKINNNEERIINNKNITIQNAISKADLITISIGFNEILYKYNNSNKSYIYDYIDSYINDMDELIKLIKKYNNKTIFVLGYYNPISNNELDKYIIYSNNKLISLCSKEKVNYVNIYYIFKNNKKLIYNTNNYYPNQEGYKLIASEIIKKLK